MSRRPFSATLSTWLVLFLTAWNGLRLFTAIQWRAALTEYAVSQPPILTALVGAVWLVTGLILLRGLLWRKPWAGRILLWAAVGYSVWYWIERFLWQQPRPNWLFAVILNLILFLLILFTKRSLTRESYERKNENRTFK